jgi:hypothetical protein
MRHFSVKRKAGHSQSGHNASHSGDSVAQLVTEIRRPEGANDSAPVARSPYRYAKSGESLRKPRRRYGNRILSAAVIIPKLALADVT